MKTGSATQLWAGLTSLFFSALSFTVAVYYAWIAITPGCNSLCNEHYNSKSTLFFWSSFSLLLIAVTTLALHTLKVRRRRLRSTQL
ncbi:Hypothetical Protein XCAW_01083 [Xanthomonas citri subsp. citri Aw12879]|nr:Hypothetical Protein XCAW_01083 [Xanthomonas citri subsp. citri Aw12879]